MADCHTKEVRSRNMAQIRGANTKPELIVRRYLFGRGLRYRINVADLPGKPDIVLAKYKTVVFVHGCFWHHHDCGRFSWPKSNAAYWMKKIRGNVRRDADVRESLITQGWKVIVVWECELKPAQRDETLRRLYQDIVGEAQQER